MKHIIFVAQVIGRFAKRLTTGLLASRLILLAVMPFAQIPATAQAATPETPIATLSVQSAPKQLFDHAEPSVNVLIGESKTEQAAREAADAQKRAAEAAQADKLNRFVQSRDGGNRQSGGLSLDEARRLTGVYAAKYGVNADLMTKIVACESGYNQFAKNRRSTASGYGQFLAGTWRSTAKALGFGSDVSPFDGEKNLEATAYLMSVSGTSPWRSSAGCWK